MGCGGYEYAFFILVLLFYTPFPIALVKIGTKNLNDTCTLVSDIPYLLLYIVIQGAVSLFGINLMLINQLAKDRIETVMGVLFPILSLHNLSWAIVGSVRLYQDINCDNDN